MKKAILIALLFFVATNSPAQTISFTCRVDSVLSDSRKETRFTAIREDNCEKVFLTVNWEPFVTRIRAIKRGVWVTVFYNPDNCTNDSVFAKFKINKR